MTPHGKKTDVISVRRLMWRKFRRNKAALIGGAVIILLYVIVLPGEFFAPYGLQNRHLGYNYAPPQRLHFFDSERRFHFWPFAYNLVRTVDLTTFQPVYREDKSERYPLAFFVHGDKYRLWGLVSTDLHFIGVKKGGEIFFLGTDRQGRDLLSRIIIGGRVSMTISLLGVILSVIFGSIFGVISGYYGGLIDHLIQRTTEVLMSFPAIPLWMALAAAMPPTWSSIQSFFVITIILSLINWASLARQVRGKILVTREQDYVTAAKAIGATEGRIIVHHLLPSALSHIVVVATLSFPTMIAAEAVLSFLGLGIRPPMTSWGVLLRESQKVTVLTFYPWIISPAFFVIIAILAFNFLGDGLRDAADPFSR